MRSVYIKRIVIERVGHLRDIDIKIGNKKTNIILTGDDTAGRDSLLQAMKRYLNAITTDGEIIKCYDFLQNNKCKDTDSPEDAELIKRGRSSYMGVLRILKRAYDCFLELGFSVPKKDVWNMYGAGEFVVGAYGMKRKPVTLQEENRGLKLKYTIDEIPGKDFIKYFIDIYSAEAIARRDGDKEKKAKMNKWLNSFREMLKLLYDDDTMDYKVDKIKSDIIIIQGEKVKSFLSCLSDGYGVILSIITDLMMRMEKKTEQRFKYDVSGVVLIDSIEVKLEPELQKRLMNVLTTMFPKIQFIVSTNSQYIINETKNAFVYEIGNDEKADDDNTEKG